MLSSKFSLNSSWNKYILQNKKNCIQIVISARLADERFVSIPNQLKILHVSHVGFRILDTKPVFVKVFWTNSDCLFIVLINTCYVIQKAGNFDKIESLIFE